MFCPPRKSLCHSRQELLNKKNRENRKSIQFKLQWTKALTIEGVFRCTCFYTTHKALEYQENAGLLFIQNIGLYSCFLKMLFLKLLPFTYYLPLIKELEERNLHSVVTRGLWIGWFNTRLHRKGCLFIVKSKNMEEKSIKILVSSSWHPFMSQGFPKPLERMSSPKQTMSDCVYLHASAQHLNLISKAAINNRGHLLKHRKPNPKLLQ